MTRLLILLMMVSQPAWAEWDLLGQTPGGKDITYIDPATLRKTVDGRRVWTMSTHDSPQTHRGMTYRSVRQLIEYDCAGERTRVLQQELFSGLMLEGASVYRSTGIGAWEYPAPSTGNDQELKVVCRMPLK